MGRQINFFLHQDDQIEFDDFLKSFGEIVFIRDHHYSDKIIPIADTLVRDISQEKNRVYLLKPTDLNSLSLTHQEKFNYWYLESSKYPVLHFDRSIFNANKIQRGRLYYQPQFVLDSNWIKKSEDFVKWADRIINAARRKLKKYNYEIGGHSYFDYLGSKALEWAQNTNAQMISGGSVLIAESALA